jgi:hypothetical protein
MGCMIRLEKWGQLSIGGNVIEKTPFSVTLVTLAELAGA